MASYAVLGATGNTGNSLVQLLAKNPNTKVNCYCRNKAKLFKVLPDVAEQNNVEVFDGSIEDVELMTRCIRGCRSVFMTVTSNDNIPGCHLAQDSAHSVIAALKKIRAEQPDYKMPKLLLLSSVTIDPYLGRTIPKWFHPIMLKAASFVYDDLRAAESLMRAEEDWVTSIYVKPGGLSIDIQRGHRLSLTDHEAFVSYLDLAASMIEAADESGTVYDNRNVSICNVNGSAKFPSGVPVTVICGLLRHYFPWLHPYLPMTY